MSIYALKSFPRKRLSRTETPANRTNRAGIDHALQTGSSPAEREFLQRPIEFVAHPAFKRPDPERLLKRKMPLPGPALPAALPDQPGLTFVAGFVSQPLLTATDEVALFAWMNFHRFRAERLRQQALRSKSPARLITRLRGELRAAQDLRNRIVSSNLRLVVSLAKKLSRSLDHMSELISEGVLPLIRSVELFDISLGNRFSTYATWAVRNQMLRCIKRAATASAAAGTSELPLESLADQHVEIYEDPSTASPAKQVQSLIADLPDRERLVLRARFGLAGEPAGQSLAEVAARVGLSKERVRQIVLNTLEQLRGQFVQAGDV